MSEVLLYLYPSTRSAAENVTGNVGNQSIIKVRTAHESFIRASQEGVFRHAKCAAPSLSRSLSLSLSLSQTSSTEVSMPTFELRPWAMGRFLSPKSGSASVAIFISFEGGDVPGRYSVARAGVQLTRQSLGG